MKDNKTKFVSCFLVVFCIQKVLNKRTQGLQKECQSSHLYLRRVAHSAPGWNQ